MKKNNKSFCIFLSPPCTIYESKIVTDSSWYKFISTIGDAHDKVKIISPELIPSNTSFSIKPNFTNVYEKVDHFYFNSFKSFYKKFFKNPFRLIRNYYSIIKSSDCVIFRIPNPGYILVAIISLLLKKPLMFISGNIKEQSDTLFNSSGIFKLFLTFVMKLRIKLHSFFIKKSSHVFCVSRNILDLYSISKSKKIEILRTPVISLQDIVEETDKPSQKEKNVFKIIRACWLQESKGLETLIEAISKISTHHNIKLDIYGSARDKKYEDKINKLISRLDLKDTVTLCGWISNKDLLEIFSEYDLHLMTSVSEGMPRVCLESSAKGLPQLLTPVGGVLDFFTHLENAYITQDSSAESIKEGIKWFLNNRKLANQIAKNSLNSSKESSIEWTSKNFQSVINKLVS